MEYHEALQKQGGNERILLFVQNCFCFTFTEVNYKNRRYWLTFAFLYFAILYRGLHNYSNSVFIFSLLLCIKIINSTCFMSYRINIRRCKGRALISILHKQKAEYAFVGFVGFVLSQSVFSPYNYVYSVLILLHSKRYFARPLIFVRYVIKKNQNKINKQNSLTH